MAVGHLGAPLTRMLKMEVIADFGHTTDLSSVLTNGRCVIT